MVLWPVSWSMRAGVPASCRPSPVSCQQPAASSALAVAAGLAPALLHDAEQRALSHPGEHQHCACTNSLLRIRLRLIPYPLSFLTVAPAVALTPGPLSTHPPHARSHTPADQYVEPWVIVGQDGKPGACPAPLPRPVLLLLALALPRLLARLPLLLPLCLPLPLLLPPSLPPSQRRRPACLPCLLGRAQWARWLTATRW